MEGRTVDWTGWGAPDPAVPEGLRERKKRQMRQRLSDTATEMFMQRGFDGVRVAEIAEACGVSEKTVFNYFPTKESLLLDRWDATMGSLRIRLADPLLSPTQAAVGVLDDELHGLTSWMESQDDALAAGSRIRRFGTLIRSTPALRSHQRDMTDRLIAAAAEVLAGRAALRPDDPEPQIAAIALLGLWQIQFNSLTRHLDGTRTPAQIHQAVSDDVRRAAGLIEKGLRSLALSGDSP
jgi:AcrR family transcriptional regulator